MKEMDKLNTENLEEVSGGFRNGQWMTVHGLQPADYLIVRSGPEATQATEIGGLCNGDDVQIAGGTVVGTDVGGPAMYVYVYVPKFGLNGYVNVDFIW